MWTGVDYLGEADGAWPTFGSTAGIMDELGDGEVARLLLADDLGRAEDLAAGDRNDGHASWSSRPITRRW